MSVVSFRLVNTQPVTFKVYKMADEGDTMPNFLRKGMIVTLVTGKWPLKDYLDAGDCHTFVFQKADGSRFSMLLRGFTYDCTYPLEQQQKHVEAENVYIGIDVREILKAQEKEDMDE